MKTLLLKIWNNRLFAIIFRTNMGRLLFAFIWTSGWLLLYNNISAEWPFYVGLIGIAYILVVFLIMIAYAWIINPINRRYKNNKL